VELDNDDDTSSESDCSQDTDIDLGEITETNLMLTKAEKIKKPLIEDIT
jgi:hypothetical protein